MHLADDCIAVSAGLLAARTASVATGESESSTGVKLEGLFKAGTARPIMEALTTYAQDLQNIECASGRPCTLMETNVICLWSMVPCGGRHFSLQLRVTHQGDVSLLRRFADTVIAPVGPGTTRCRTT